MRINYSKLLLEVKLRLVTLQNHLVIFMIATGYLKMQPKQKFVRLGTTYGGWYVSTKFLNSQHKKVVVSAGLGHDVSFDLEMLKQNFLVIGLDPLSSSCLYAQQALSGYQNRVQILNSGLWKESGSVVFHAPSIAEHDSWSILNVQESQSNDVQVYPVTDLDSLARTYGEIRSYPLRILKMDIEGAEFDMFESISKFIPKFNQVSVEMDFVSLIKFRQLARRAKSVIGARRRLKLMKLAGYELQKIDYFNFTWVLKD